MKPSVLLTAQVSCATRLDKYLRIEYGSLQQSVIEKAIRKGDILVNSQKTNSSYRVQNGDLITIYQGHLPSSRESAQPRQFCSNAVGLANKILGQWCLYQDEDVIIINKPTKIPTQGGSKVLVSIDHAIAYINHVNSHAHYNLWRLVHRLDKDTSGALIIAKNLNAAQKITYGFKMHIIAKTYYAVVYNTPSQSEGVISSYIAPKKSKSYIENFDNSVTNYKLIRALRWMKDGVNRIGSLIAFQPQTGRNHQIRIHTASIGCPIVGDEKYGGGKELHMLLHAKELIIPVQLLDRYIKIETQLPIYFTKFLD